MELLLEFFLEVFLQLFAEFFAEATARSIRKWNRTTHPVFAALAYILLASVLAYLSFLLWPKFFISSDNFQIFSLVVNPVLVGFLMGFRGKLLLKKRKVAMRIDSFTYAYLFALVFALTRFFLIKV